MMKNKIIVEISEGKRSYREDVTEDQKEYFKEISTNGANPHLKDKTFEDWVRPIEIKGSELDEYNGNHFIFGHCECFFQGDNVPQWMYESDDLIIKVINE